MSKSNGIKSNVYGCNTAFAIRLPIYHIKSMLRRSKLGKRVKLRIWVGVTSRDTGSLVHGMGWIDLEMCTSGLGLCAGKGVVQ
jgi:hypothetical protein